MRDWMPNELEKKSQDEAAEEMEMDKGGKDFKMDTKMFRILIHSSETLEKYEEGFQLMDLNSG